MTTLTEVFDKVGRLNLAETPDGNESAKEQQLQKIGNQSSKVIDSQSLNVSESMKNLVKKDHRAPKSKKKPIVTPQDNQGQ